MIIKIILSCFSWRELALAALAGVSCFSYIYNLGDKDFLGDLLGDFLADLDEGL